MDDYVKTLDASATNPKYRRDLLWLRAHEKGDTDSAADLERADRGLCGRMRARGIVVRIDAGESTEERARRFGELFDERWREIEEELAARERTDAEPPADRPGR